MFIVQSIETNNIYTVYGCQEIRGIIYFLIHNGTCWIWTEANQFKPYVVLPDYTPPNNDWWGKPYVNTAYGNITHDSGGNKIK